MTPDRQSLEGSRFPEIVIPGWFHSHKLYEMVVEKFGAGSVFIELGSYFGESAVYMAKLLNEKAVKADFYSIDLMKSYFMLEEEDLWYGSAEKDTEHSMIISKYGKDMEKIIRHYLEKYAVQDRVRLIREDSIKVADQFEDSSVDFVYLDTDHSYSRVSREILTWYPKLKPGGILAGDDLQRDDGDDGGVQKAVNEFFRDKYSTDGTTWFSTKLDE